MTSAVRYEHSMYVSMPGLYGSSVGFVMRCLVWIFLPAYQNSAGVRIFPSFPLINFHKWSRNGGIKQANSSDRPNVLVKLWRID